MYDIETVGVQPDTSVGEAVRHLYGAKTVDSAHRLAERRIRELVKQNTLATLEVATGPHSRAYVYLDSLGQIVGYSNIAEVLGE